jgi:hypothetical protein
LNNAEACTCVAVQAKNKRKHRAAGVVIRIKAETSADFIMMQRAAMRQSQLMRLTGLTVLCCAGGDMAQSA